MKPASLNSLKTIGYWAYLAVEKHTDKTFKYETEVLKDQDPENLHQMRVGMRKLRTAVTGFAPALELPANAQEQEIGKIAKILGNLRDIDVLQEFLHHQYQPQLPKKEQRLTQKAFNELAKQRQKAFKQVQNTFKGNAYLNLTKSLQEWLAKPKFKAFAQMSVSTVLPDLLLPSISELLLHPAWFVGVKVNAGQVEFPTEITPKMVESYINEQGELLHDLRKQAKRVRYQMSLFTDLYEPSFSDYIEEVKQIQEVLGEIQDNSVLGDFLGHVFDANLKKQTPEFAGLLADNRYQAWQKWQGLQQRYLMGEVRQAFRQQVLQPKPDEVLESLNGQVESTPELAVSQ